MLSLDLEAGYTGMLSLLRAAKAYYLHKLSFHERACFNAVYFSICPQRNSDIFSSIEQKIADN